MSGIEPPLIAAAATGFIAPAMNAWLQEMRSNREKNISIDDLHKNLNKAFGWLLATQQDKCNEASRNTQRATSYHYQHWTKRVSDIEKTVTSLNENYERSKNKCIPFGIDSSNLKKKISSALKDAIELLENCPKEILVGYELPERVIEEVAIKSIAEYPTLQNAFEKIQDLLKDDRVKCVALHGIIGVGKTTIMKHLNNHPFKDSSDNKKFDLVIFVKVASDVETDESSESLHILQKIADRVKVGKEGDESEVARRIWGVLIDKRFLLILDGIRRKPDLIWESLKISIDKKNSKVVITTNNSRAFKTKYVDRIVELKYLETEEEAWTMFQGIVGKDDLPETAERVCERFCCRLPLLIYHMANSFKQDDPPYWQRALKESTPWPEVNVQGLAELNQRLKICYDKLSAGKQKCFLYASQYPANSNIYTQYLVECCIVQDFLDCVQADTDYSERRIEVVDTILTPLINFSFLEQGEHKRYVKMNYFYWQLASYILSKDPDLKGRTFFDNGNHKEFPQGAIWFSRIGSKSKYPPENKNCASLKSLLLQKNLKLVGFRSDYFQSMGNLVVLNLYRTIKSELPSLEGLTNLKAFYLNGCSNLTIARAEIERLLKLEVLDVRDTKVNFVPCIESLWCLRIPHMPHGNYQGISVLQKLEELTIEVEGRHPEEWHNNAERIMDAVASLEKLKILRYYFYSSEFPEDFQKEASESWMREKIRTESLPFEIKKCAINEMIPRAVRKNMILELIKTE